MYVLPEAVDRHGMVKPVRRPEPTPSQDAARKAELRRDGVKRAVEQCISARWINVFLRRVDCCLRTTQGVQDRLGHHLIASLVVVTEPPKWEQ